ncbi:MAG: carboxypeptidase-like regulatory domain-containing protein [Pyrinomonadaceae bacterium]|nr:carboxypeptidase-like regulatory domain-containing protein [Pyrinomonadaceae bacterium]
MIRFSNSGWFGGKGGQADRAELRAEFFNANSNVIGTSDVGAITAIDRNNTTGLIFKTTGDELPPTTRRIKFTLFMTQSSGPNDGYADNLNFSMSTVTAASVTISGRVVNSDGGAVRGAIVSLTGSDGLSRTSRTNAFGYFRFQEIEAGQSVLLNVRAKGKIFEPNSTLLNIQDEISGLEFRSVN